MSQPAGDLVIDLSLDAGPVLMTDGPGTPSFFQSGGGCQKKPPVLLNRG